MFGGIAKSGALSAAQTYPAKLSTATTVVSALWACLAMMPAVNITESTPSETASDPILSEDLVIDEENSFSLSFFAIACRLRREGYP